VKFVGGNRRILRRRRCRPWSLSKMAKQNDFRSKQKEVLNTILFERQKESERLMEVRHNFPGPNLLPGGLISSSFVVFSFDRIRKQQSTIRSTKDLGRVNDLCSCECTRHMHTILVLKYRAPVEWGPFTMTWSQAPHGARPIAGSPRPSIEHGHGRTATAPFNNQPQAHITMNERVNNARGRF